MTTKTDMAQQIQEILDSPQRTREVVVAAFNALHSMKTLQADPKSNGLDVYLSGTSILNAALFASGKLT